VEACSIRCPRIRARDKDGKKSLLSKEECAVGGTFEKGKTKMKGESVSASSRRFCPKNASIKGGKVRIAVERARKKSRPRHY